MRYIINIPALLIVMLSLVSCRKYVEDVPVQGQRVLVYTTDYRLLLNDYNTLDVAYGQMPELSSDDIDFTAPELKDYLSTSPGNLAIYTWRKPFFTGDEEDSDWNAMYKAIYVLNTVAEGVLGSKGGALELRNQLLGEALVHRAFTYFMLSNCYAKQYDKATAATDPGVPLLLKPLMFVSLPRASVQQTYDQILDDIKQAIPKLPAKPETKMHPGKAAAYALLSKVYLFMREFDQAAAFADSSLAISNTLYDYNDIIASGSSSFPSQFNDPQVLLRKGPRMSFSALQLSQSLLTLLDTRDIRYELFVKDANSGFYPAFNGLAFYPRENYSGYPDKAATGLTVNETMLIKSECLARAGKRDEALEILNAIRKLRFRPADYIEATAASDAAALQLIVDERRREFFGTGLRWFDQRRLNKDPQFAQTVTRVIGNITYTLQPNSNGYVFPLADKLIRQNPETTQNP
jgi:tetratricopeptide (TPR) repeat protein